MMTATYSPDDNKLRLYASARLDPDLYKRVRGAGFIWAPKQELFVAPMWTPEREDLLIELCGEIDDEDTSLIDRAEERAERFEDYSDNRKADAESAHKAVAAIADNIPLGQPILVGHHSERHARKDAERIDNGMRKAVKMWKQSEYWTRRAKGAIGHAKYKERPDVRARRIKGLVADRRRFEKRRKEAEFALTFWNGELKLKNGGFLEVTSKSAIWFCNSFDHTSDCFTLADYPREKPKSQYEGMMCLWSALGGSEGEAMALITVEQAKELSTSRHKRVVANCDRWLAHIENRLAYEKAMLDDAGASHLLDKKPRRELLPLLNYRQPVFVLPNPYIRGSTLTYNQIDMVAAEYSKIYTDYKGTRIVENSHRIRTAIVKHSLVAVFLTDSKVHEKPAPVEPTPQPPAPPRTLPPSDPTEGRTIWNSDGTDGPALICPPPPKAPSFADDMKQIEARLKTGVQVVVANQLFPTPPELAQRMVDEAGIEPDHDVLEPSGGTGRLLIAIKKAAPEANLVAVEIKAHLAEIIRTAYRVPTHCADFLTLNGQLGKFDRILMNPPFQNGDDIKHIKHAITFLKPGGRLVAICANGPRQNEQLKPLASTWEELPHDTFKEQGTGVRTVLLTIEA